MFVRSSNFFWTRLLSLSAFGYYMYHHNVQNYTGFLYIMLRSVMSYIYIHTHIDFNFKRTKKTKPPTFWKKHLFFAQQKLHSSARFNNSWDTAMDSSAVTSHVKQARRLRKPGTSGGGGGSYGYHSTGKYMTYLTQGERRKIIIHAYPRKSAGLIFWICDRSQEGIVCNVCWCFLLGGLFWFHRKKRSKCQKYQLAENRGIPQSYKLLQGRPLPAGCCFSIIVFCVGFFLEP